MLDESVVVHADQALYLGVGVPDAVAGHRPGHIVIIEDEQVRLGASLASGTTTANGAIRLATREEIQFHAALRLAVGDQVVVVLAAGPGLSPKAPGHRVQQRRFAVSVGPAEAGDVHAAKIQGRHVIAVTEEVANGQFEGDHFIRDCNIRQSACRTRTDVMTLDGIISYGTCYMTTHQDDETGLDGDPIIVVEDLRKRYGDVQAVDGVSFNVKRGEVFALLGPNGSGKTTTVEIIEGMRTADSGRATVGGIDVKQNPRAVKQIIGVQLQSSAFFEHLRLSELLLMLGSIYGAAVDPDALLDAVELGEKRAASFRTLSGGQKQRFAIASSLVNDPEVIFLDEPTTGLDPQARHRIWDLTLNWKAEGRTVVLTTHYMEEAEELCDRVAVMDSGRIIAMAPPGELIDDLIARGFEREHEVRLATLEDVFLDLTGRSLREF